MKQVYEREKREKGSSGWLNTTFSKKDIFLESAICTSSERRCYRQAAILHGVEDFSAESEPAKPGAPKPAAAKPATRPAVAAPVRKAN